MFRGMKLGLMLFMCVLFVGNVYAADVGVTTSYVYDFNLKEGGARAEISMGSQKSPFTPKMSATYIEDVYTRYAIGGDIDLYKIGPVSFDATINGVYQETRTAEDGFGVAAGLKASVDINKNVALTAGYERFLGENKVDDFDGDIVTAGLTVMF